MKGGDAGMNTEDIQQQPALRSAVVDFLYQLADDDLVQGHRDSEWLGLAPEIEEDVAFSSISQDEVGHATFYYGLLESLGEGNADELAFQRPAAGRRNALLTERENGDWAYTIVRHYLYDVFEDARLQALENSSYLALRQGAVKIRREEFYHLLHFETWFRRLAMAGGEARQRIESALAMLWTDFDNLFDLGPHARMLQQHGILSSSADELRQAVMVRVRTVMAGADLALPDSSEGEVADRSRHTDALRELFDTMNEVRELQPGAVW